MAWVSLGFLAVYSVVCVAGRAWLHHRRTGRTPFRSGSANGKGVVIGYGTVFALPPILDLTGTLPPLAGGPGFAAAGCLCSAAGVTLTFWSTLVMGDSWRIGVDARERTPLVTTSVYRWVRNPIYTAMAIFALGLALLVPNLATIGALIASAIALEIVVRSIEEPHLTKIHRQDYLAWASTTGRFVPHLGAIHIS